MPRAVKLTDRFKILARDNFRCVYCGATPQAAELHIDHAKPRSKGGEDNLSNYVTACFACNVGKRDLILSEIMGRTEYLNTDWKCDHDGMEHRSCGYYIEKERLNEVADYIGPWCSEWIAHMARKAFDFDLFIDAFYKAFLMTGTPMRFDWHRSVEHGRKKIARSKAWEAEFDRRIIAKYGERRPFITPYDFTLMNDFRGEA